jgi:hypothetical protein
MRALFPFGQPCPKKNMCSTLLFYVQINYLNKTLRRTVQTPLLIGLTVTFA